MSAATANKNSGHIHVCVALGEAWRAQFSDMRSHLPGLLKGDDSEELHRFRIALRQTRALLKIARDVIPDADKFVTEFKWLAAAMGTLRDLDIQLQYVRDFSVIEPNLAANAAAIEPILVQLEIQRAQQQAQLMNIFDSDRCRELLAAWQQFISGLPQLSAQTSREVEKSKCVDFSRAARTPLAGWAMVTIIRQSRQILKAGVLVDEKTPAPVLHQLRIRCKRLRYVLESLAPFDKKLHLKSLLEKLAALQKILGAHQDAITAAAQWQILMVHFSATSLPASVDRMALLLHWIEIAEREQREARAQLPHALLAFAKFCKF